ncbi:MAG: CCA tRNA nucleotidyltransferase [Bacteroidota bacterium]|nr:CCA tRNA nucleotidyltransferase [Bacteroidota bacterium]MDX5431750.1 CCA tRNA nucleotidyltransferase [Bacteroidota bacterium]MDX5470465.1 CCA tRNA nucleotidyltransferase [Bacteroidota bacterium]
MFAEALKQDFFRIIGEVADQQNLEVYVIGGYVRDCILKRPSKDVDIVVMGSGIDLAHAVAEKMPSKPHVNFYSNFGTANLKTDSGWDIEFVGARRESYQRNSRKPIVEDGTLEDDQNRRDFTINALALCLNQARFGELVDPFDGLSDLQKAWIRTPLDPDITFSDDPLRMMRAIRFATQLDFEILPPTLKSIERNAERIDIVSMERVSDELNKIILSPVPSKGFLLLKKTGLLDRIFPEFCLLEGVEKKNGLAHKDNFFHTLQVLDNLAAESNDLWLRWSAILHDIAKPQTKRFEEGHGWTFHGHEDRGSRMVKPIFRRMRLPLNEKMKYVEKLVLLHLRPIVLSKEEVTDSAIRRLIVDAGEEVNDLLLLCKADITSKNEAKVKRYLKNLELVKEKIADVTERDRLRNWQPPISGHDIQAAFIIQDGKDIGRVKLAVREAILEGIIENNVPAAHEFMLRKGEELGLKRK